MKGLPRSMSRGSPQSQQIHKLTIPLTALALSIAGTTGVGFGSVVIGDLPEGNIAILGAVSYVKLTTVDADVIATFAGNYSIGSVATADVDVSDSGEADIIPSTAIAAAVAGVSALTRGASVATLSGAVLDNTDGSLELNLNVLIDDASISGTGTFTVDGVVTLSYIVLGDD